MASVNKSALDNSDFTINENQIPFFYREIPEKDLVRENENWLEFNFIDKSAYFLLSKSYLQLDVQICNRDNTQLAHNDTSIPISNGFARFNNIEFYLEDKRVSFTNNDNMHVQHILNIGKHTKEFNNNILEGMDAEIDTHEGGIGLFNSPIQSNLPFVGNYIFTAGVPNNTYQINVNININPEIDSTIASFNNYPENNWHIKFLSGNYKGYVFAIDSAIRTNNIVTFQFDGLPTMNANDNNVSIFLFSANSFLNSTGFCKRFNKYKRSRVVRLILPFNESNLELLGYPKFLTNLKWKLKLQKGDSSDIIYRNRVDANDNGLTTNLHNYRIRSAKCFVAIANTRRMLSGDFRILEKSSKLISLDHLIPFVTHKSFSSRNNTFTVREFQKTDKPLALFFFMQSGTYSDVRNNEFSNPLIYDHMFLESINLEINGFTLYEEDLRCRFYENNTNPLASDSFNNTLDYDIAFKYLVSAYKGNKMSLIDKNQFRNVYPIFYFDLERLNCFEFNTDVPVTLSVRYKLGPIRDADGVVLNNAVPTHEAYALVMIKNHIEIDTSPSVAKITVN